MAKKCFMCGNTIKMMDAHCVTKDKYALCYEDAKRLFPENRSTRMSISMKTALFVQKHTHSEIQGLLDGTLALSALTTSAPKPSKQNNIDPQLKEIKRQLDQAGVSDLFGTKKEVRELPNIIDMDSEVIKYAASGFVDNNTVLIVCTNERVIFIDKGFVYGIKTSDIPLDMVNGVSYSKGLILGSVSVTNGANTTLIENVQKQAAQILADTIKNEAYKFKKDKNNSSVSTTYSDFASQLKDLKKLLDEGIITEEEFTAKKKQILGI